MVILDQAAIGLTKKRAVHVTNQIGNKMNVSVKTFEKSVKLVTGKEVTKSGSITMPVFATEADVTALLGENIAAFAAYGFRNFCKTHAANQISGAGKKDKDLKANLRNFKNSLEVLKNVMDLDTDTAVSVLLKKEQFASLADYLKSLEVSEGPIAFDYSSKFPVPKLGEADEDEESTDNE